MWAILHDNAVARGLCADTLELNDVWMVELPQVMDGGLTFVFDFLDGNQLVVQFADEDGALGSGTQPLQVGN